jgi:Beta-lactamase
MADIPDWLVFPEAEWKTLSPAAAGFKEPDLTNEINALTAKPASFYEDHKPDEFAGVLTRGGYIVKKWGRTTDYLWQTASIGKAFTRAALGLAVYRLGLNPDEPVWHTWTGTGQLSHPHKYLDNDTHKNITWRHLADHTAGFGIESGFEWRWNQPTEPWRKAKWTGNPNWDMYSFRPPGEYAYSSANFIRLGQALTALWGIDLKTLLDRELFSKIGIPAERWSWMSLREVYQNYRMYPRMPGYGHYCDLPHEINGVVVHGGPGWVLMNAEDLARFGLLVATGGIWKGQELLSSEWLISKSGGNMSAVFGDAESFVAGSRVTADGMPPYMWAHDAAAYSFPETLIDPNIVPGKGVPKPASPKAYVFGINQSNGALSEIHSEGPLWKNNVIDANANLSRLAVVFDAIGPQAFGIRRDNQALYQAFWDGKVWKTGVLDAAANLSALSVVFDDSADAPQVFGIRADNRALYQAYKGLAWNFRVLDANANLSALDAVFVDGAPQVFGIRADNRALYQAFWNGAAWEMRVLDANANLQSLSVTIDDDSGSPQVFGIRADNRALYQAYYDGIWKFRTLDAAANLSGVSSVFHSTTGVRQVFGVRADTKKLYQAAFNTGWVFSDIDDTANLAAVAGVFEGTSAKTQVFGIRGTNKALYQAFFDDNRWKSAVVDANANLAELDVAFGALKTFELPA